MPDFDPYHTWLGIPPNEQPPDLYRLLGIAKFETKPDVISNAADARMTFLRSLQAGARAVYCQQLLNEVSAACTTLLDASRKGAYDAKLRLESKTIPLPATISQTLALPPFPDLVACMQRQQDLLQQLRTSLDQWRQRLPVGSTQHTQTIYSMQQVEAAQQTQSQRESQLWQQESELERLSQELARQVAEVQEQGGRVDITHASRLQQLDERRRNLLQQVQRQRLEVLQAGRILETNLAQNLTKVQTALSAAAAALANVPNRFDDLPRSTPATLPSHRALPQSQTEPEGFSLQSIPPPVLWGGIGGASFLVIALIVFIATRGGGTPEVATPTVDMPAATLPSTPIAATGAGISRPTIPTAGGGSRIDLLSQIEIPRDTFRGLVKFEKKRLSLGGPNEPYHCVLLPHQLPEHYQLDLHVICRAGDALIVGCGMQGKSCVVHIDGFAKQGGKRTALERIDNLRPLEPGYPAHAKFGQLLKPNVESKLSIRVVGKNLELTCDGKPVLDWTGEPGRLSVDSKYDPKKPNSIFVGSWDSTYEITALSLQPLAATAHPSALDRSVTEVARTAAQVNEMPWIWARPAGMLNGISATPDGKYAALYSAEQSPVTTHLIEGASGSRVGGYQGDNASGTSPLRRLQLSSGSPFIAAFSRSDASGGEIGVVPLTSEGGHEYSLKPHTPLPHLALSGDGRHLAYSGGDALEAVTIIDLLEKTKVSHLTPPTSGTATIELLQYTGDQLVCVYVQSDGKRLVNVVDGKAPAAGRQYVVSAVGQNPQWQGARFLEDQLWIYGRDDTNGALLVNPQGTGLPNRVQYYQRSASHTLVDFDIRTRRALVIDPAGTTLQLVSFGSKREVLSTINFSSPVAAARFVDGAKGFVTITAKPFNPVLMWHTHGVVQAQQWAAPTSTELGIATSPGSDKQEKAFRNSVYKAVEPEPPPAAVATTTPEPMPVAPVAPAVSDRPFSKLPSVDHDPRDTEERNAARKALYDITMQIKPGPNFGFSFKSANGRAFTDELSPHLVVFPELSQLSFDQPRITSTTLEVVARLPALLQLNIENCAGEDNWLEILKRTKLKTLLLQNVILAPEALPPLKEFKTLETFSLTPCTTVPQWEAIGSLTSLKKLGMLDDTARLYEDASQSGIALDDQGLEAIRNLAKLQSIGLQNSQVTSEGIKHLSRMKALTNLALPRQVDSADLRVLGLLPAITQLTATGLQDGHMSHVARCSKLTTLTLVDPQMTKAGFAKLVKMESLRSINLVRFAMNEELSDDLLEGVTQLRTLQAISFKGFNPDAISMYKLKEKLPRAAIGKQEK